MEYELLSDVVNVLNKNSERVSPVSTPHRRYSFNVVAKNVKGKNLVLAVTTDVDRVGRSSVRDLLVISYTTKSVPLIVSEKCKGKLLVKGVIYKRFGIYTMNFKTFKEIHSTTLKREVYTLKYVVKYLED